MTERTFIIAEAGVNHNGDPELARRLVDAAADCGADAVKFQTFRAELLVSPHAPKADYQLAATDTAESQYTMLKNLELPRELHFDLKQHCATRNIEFMSTPFDTASGDFLVNELAIERIKIPSGEITNGPFLLHLARYGLPIIMSTGMSTLEDVEQALVVLAHGLLKCSGQPTREAFQSKTGQEILRQKLTLLHCTTEYPAPLEHVNLRAMDTLKQKFDLPVGFSDHTKGIAIAIAAAARGARIVEKHFTLDRSLPGPDHQASLEVDELNQMVNNIRMVESALGTAEKTTTPPETKNRAVARQSLVAACPISKGDVFSTDNVTSRRPGTGLSPMVYWELIGQKAPRDFMPDECLEL